MLTFYGILGKKYIFTIKRLRILLFLFSMILILTSNKVFLKYINIILNKLTQKKISAKRLNKNFSFYRPLGLRMKKKKLALADRSLIAGSVLPG